jgi:hypothetical protein
MPPGSGAAGAAFFSGFSATTASVVRNSAVIDAAFCSAERVTLAGSMIDSQLPWPVQVPDRDAEECGGQTDEQ